MDHHHAKFLDMILFQQISRIIECSFLTREKLYILYKWRLDEIQQVTMGGPRQITGVLDSSKLDSQNSWSYGENVAKTSMGERMKGA